MPENIDKSMLNQKIVGKSIFFIFVSNGYVLWMERMILIHAYV